MSKAGWKLLEECGEVVQVARNSVTFQVPGLLGKLTFLDPLSSYLEVVVELPDFVAEKHGTKIFPEIYKNILAAVKEAMETLNYEVKEPELAFLCPEQSSHCSILPHIASVDTSLHLLTCSLVQPMSFAPSLLTRRCGFLNLTVVSHFFKIKVLYLTTFNFIYAGSKETFSKQRPTVAPPITSM